MLVRIPKFIFKVNYFDYQLLFQMILGEKKKRNHSGPRSKSKKVKSNELSVDFKSKQIAPPSQPPELNPKTKTENSSSLNKSKPSRKVSTKQPKKHTKSHIKDKDIASHSISAERKHSLTKMNKTEANFENEDIQKRIFLLKKNLSKIERPKCTNIQLIQQYYRQIKQSLQTTSQPLYSICVYMHELYLSPILNILEMISPYEDLLKRKEEITVLIDEQVRENQKLYSQLDPIDEEIFKLKEKIEEQRVALEEKRKIKREQEKKADQLYQKMQENQNIMKKVKTQSQVDKNIVNGYKRQKLQSATMGIGLKGFKLDLQGVSKNTQSLGFHDQFYSKIDEFSESWRNQALREKRF